MAKDENKGDQSPALQTRDIQDNGQDRLSPVACRGNPRGGDTETLGRFQVVRSENIEMYLSENNSYVAENETDFDGFEILMIDDWKPGVKRVHMRKIYPGGSGSFYLLFTDEKLTDSLVVGQTFHGETRI